MPEARQRAAGVGVRQGRPREHTEARCRGTAGRGRGGSPRTPLRGGDFRAETRERSQSLEVTGLLRKTPHFACPDFFGDLSCMCHFPWWDLPCLFAPSAPTCPSLRRKKPRWAGSTRDTWVTQKGPWSQAESRGRNDHVFTPNSPFNVAMRAFPIARATAVKVGTEVSAEADRCDPAVLRHSPAGRPQARGDLFGASVSSSVQWEW